MQKNLENRVLKYCIRHEMFQEGDSVVLGVSGGADSVCLLFVLLALQKEFQLKLHVVHVNHGIRPDAGADAAYVEKLCRDLEIPFYLIEKNIPQKAAEWGVSEEEAGRRVRYEAFEGILAKQKADKIAVAHNAGDRAETMLFHLFRGTGVTGLCSIRPVRERIVRPLLCLEREEIEDYLEARQIAWRHDSTNDSDDYTRNKIRHHILNYAEKEIVSGCVGNMTRTADILAETENYIEEQINAAVQVCVRAGASGKEKAFLVDCERYLQLHSLIQKRLLLRLLKELSPMHKDIGAVHVEDIHSLFEKPGNRSIHLPYGIRGSRQYGQILLTQGKEDRQEPISQVCIEPCALAKEEWHLGLENGGEISLRLIKCGESGINCKDIPQNQYTKWFDYDKIKECLVFRTRQKGDYLSIKGPGGIQHKKVKDYMIDKKLLPKDRQRLPLLAEGSHVLWLVGYRISEYYKVDENTKNILQVCYRNGEEKKNGISY